MSDASTESFQPGPPRHLSWWVQQAVFTRKELRETLRDRRTIVTLLAMPLLLYPMLGLVFRLVALQDRSSAPRVEYRIAVATEREAEWLQEALAVAFRNEPPAAAAASEADSSPPKFLFMQSVGPQADGLGAAVAEANAELGGANRISAGARRTAGSRGSSGVRRSARPARRTRVLSRIPRKS